jgi:L-fuculose-phosphate aldolase
VVHAHPPIATAWTVARPDLEELPVACVAEVILGAGRIPFVEYARPGTPAVAAAVEPYLPDHRVLVLRRHGALAWGESGEEAFAGIDRLEHSARLLMAAETIGGLTSLPDEEVEELRRMRRARGARLL